MDTQAIRSVRDRRQELGEAMHQLDRAIASPAPGREPAWLEVVRPGLERVVVGWTEHVAVTEGPGGLHDRVLERAPRLTTMVVGLQAEHASLLEALEDSLAGLPGDDELDRQEVVRIRHLTLALLSRIHHHRHRGADLVYEAFTVDIGSSE
jgi:hypothetical protein